jgi:hypothetical protein
MRRCSRCDEEKPIEEFPERKLGTGRRYGHCRACKALYQKEWYERNKERHKRNVAALRRTSRLERQRIVKEAKDVPCADCGLRYPPYVLDFDHRAGEVKAGNISQMVSKTTTEALLAEIAKCDVVCANCHRERTYGDRESAWHRRDTPWSRERKPTSGDSTASELHTTYRRRCPR